MSEVKDIMKNEYQANHDQNKLDQPSTEELMNRVNQSFDQMTEEVKNILTENNQSNNNQ